jgi:hypothetical protein
LLYYVTYASVKYHTIELLAYFVLFRIVMLLPMDLRLVTSLDTSNPLKLLRSNLSVLQQTGKVARE